MRIAFDSAAVPTCGIAVMEDRTPTHRRRAGWLAIRPRWIVHRCYSGPWRPA